MTNKSFWQRFTRTYDFLISIPNLSFTWVWMPKLKLKYLPALALLLAFSMVVGIDSQRFLWCTIHNQICSLPSFGNAIQVIFNYLNSIHNVFVSSVWRKNNVMKYRLINFRKFHHFYQKNCETDCSTKQYSHVEFLSFLLFFDKSTGKSLSEALLLP